MSPALSCCSAFRMLCCLSIICFHLLPECHHLFIIVLSSFYHLFYHLFTIFVHSHHLSLSSFLSSLSSSIPLLIILCYLYHPPFLSLSSFLSSLSSSIPLLISFCYLYHPPFLSLSSFLSSLSSSIPLLVIFLVILTILQPSSYHLFFSHHLPYRLFCCWSSSRSS